MFRLRSVPAAAFLLVLLGSLTACGGSGSAAKTGQIPVVAAENQYGNIVSQIGGRYVSVTSVESNPNTDPHSYEVSPSTAQEVSAARLVIENGLGYDGFMDKLESAAANSTQMVVTVQRVLDMPDGSRNPHLWYRVSAMPTIARVVAGDLAALQPAHTAYFMKRLARFDSSVDRLLARITQFKQMHTSAAVATTEPVADYLLAAMGIKILTPFRLESDVMNGIDPSPQDVTRQNQLLSDRRVSALVYNRQVTDSITQSFLSIARQSKIPVVGVYETMPTPGYDYQSWMSATVGALIKATKRTETAGPR